MRRDALAMVLVAACGGPAAAPEPACPPSTRADATRAAAIEARLGSVPEGRALLASRDRVAGVCFGGRASASVITSDHVVLLADGLEEGEAAARLGHLLVHARDGLPIDAIPPDATGAACDAAVDRALVLEARAYVVEVALQDALEAHPTSLGFEFAPAIRAAVPDARESIALAYLHAHPDGAPGIDGLASAYRARCDEP